MDVKTLLDWIATEIVKAKANVDYNQVLASWWFWIDLLTKSVPAIIGAVGVYLSAKKKLSEHSFRVSILSILLTAILLAFPAGSIYTQYQDAAKGWNDIAFSLTEFEQKTENSNLEDGDLIDSAMMDGRIEILRRIHVIERPETATWRTVWNNCYGCQLERLWGKRG